MASGKAGLDFSALSGKPLGFRDVTAAGTGQSTATALANYSGFLYSSSSDGTTAVKLPAGYLGEFIVVHNKSTATGVLNVYPSTSGTVNGQSANAAFAVGIGATAFFFCRAANTWVALSSAGGGSGSGSQNAITITDATTPSLTTQAGSTNTGFVLINGKTSGSLKITTADATAQAVVVTTAAQTVGGSTLTIPDMAGVSDTFDFLAKAQTISGVKTFTGDNVYSTEYKVLAATQNFDNQVGAGTTLTTITGMSWTVVPGTYYFKFRGTISITANNGLKMAFKLTGTSLTSLALRTYLSTDTDNTGGVSTAFTTTTDQALIFDDVATVYTNVTLEGTMVVGTGGTIALQAAEHTAHNDDCLILLGAFSQMTRVL